MTRPIDKISVNDIVLPNKALSNLELISAAKKLNIPNFRGVFLRDTLPRKAKKNDCGILNLDDSEGTGTHWTAWFKRGDKKYYFDSYGIQPPIELINYLRSPVGYTTEQIQPKHSVICGHLCLYVLKELSLGRGLQNILNELH